MPTSRGVHAGISGARQASENIDVSSGAPVTATASPPLEFVRPLGAVPVEPFLEAESQARSHLLQLVVDAGCVAEPDRPRELSNHIHRLWNAIASLKWTDSPSEHRRLVPEDPAVTAARRLTVQRFLNAVDRPDDVVGVIGGATE